MRRRALRNHGHNVEIRPFARTPMIRVMVNGRSADLIMYTDARHVESDCQAALFLDYASVDERVRDLVLLVKHWSKRR
jgi:DNA polymerase sigma